MMCFIYFEGGVQFPPVGMLKHQYSLISLMRSRFFRKHPTSYRECSPASISCLSENLNATCKTNEVTAKVIYSVAPAVGHNQVVNQFCVYAIDFFIKSSKDYKDLVVFMDMVKLLFD